MTDYKTLLLLASEMLDLAQDKFSNHICNDLNDDVIKMIPQSLCDEIRQWNCPDGTESWPSDPIFIGDSSLMHFLSERLREMATEINRDVKISEIGIKD